MNPRISEQDVERVFDRYCKKVLKEKNIDLQREAIRRGEREVTFSALSTRELAELAVMDEYFKDAYIFDVHGESVSVTDSDLAEALNALAADKREIVLMSFFFDMSDREIAERLNMARRTVAQQRTNTIKALKQLMESEE